MSAYIIGSYEVTNAAAFAGYRDVVVPIIADHGGEVLVVDPDAEGIEGEPPHVAVVIRFPDKDAARRFVSSGPYAEVSSMRLENTDRNTFALANGV